MRTISADLDSILTSKSRSDHLKVEVDSDGAGAFVNLCAYNGWDWVKSVTIEESIDQPVTTAKVTAIRAMEDINMSPLMANSIVNATSDLLYVGRQIKVYFATVAIDVEPASGDWALKFDGFIDDIDMAGSNEIKLSCRDLGARLTDTFIKTINVYGTAGGSPVQTEMQAILTAHMDAPVPTLYVPASPGWNILEFKQRKEPVLRALMNLAGQIGWDLRYRWRQATLAYELTLYGPDRSSPSVDRTFDPDDYMVVPKSTISRKDIRNDIKVFYRTTHDGPLNEASNDDSGSISKFGRRYMEVTEAASSNIDSAGEAQTMVDRMLIDLKDLALIHAIKMPLFWPAELNDYYSFTDNNRTHDQTQSLAVFAISHAFTASGEAWTKLQLRGLPTAGVKRWLATEGRPGIAAPNDDYSDAAATGLTTTVGPGSIVVTYDDPRGMSPPVSDWLYTECHVSQSSGFTPGPSTLQAIGKTTRFVVEGLVSGETYYVKLAIVDSSGNVATISGQQTIVAGYAGAAHLSRENELGSIILNPTMSDWTPPHVPGSHPPDNWTPATSDGVAPFASVPALWRSTPQPLVYFEATTSSLIQSTDTSIKISRQAADAATWYGIMSKVPVPCSGDTIYDLEWIVRQETAFSVIVQARFWNEDKSSIVGNVARTGTLPAISTWHRELTTFKTPSTARWVDILAAINSPGAVDRTLYVDRMSISRGRASFRSEDLAGTSISHNTWTKLNFVTTIFDNGNVFVSPTFTAPELGEYAFEACVGLDTLADTKSMQIAIYVNGTAFTRSAIAENNSGAARDTYAQVTTQPYALAAGDTVEVYCWHNNGVATTRNTLTGDRTQFSGAAQR